MKKIVYRENLGTLHSCFRARKNAKLKKQKKMRCSKFDQNEKLEMRFFAKFDRIEFLEMCFFDRE